MRFFFQKQYINIGSKLGFELQKSINCHANGFFVHYHMVVLNTVKRCRL